MKIDLEMALLLVMFTFVFFVSGYVYATSIHVEQLNSCYERLQPAKIAQH